MQILLLIKKQMYPESESKFTFGGCTQPVPPVLLARRLLPLPSATPAFHGSPTRASTESETTFASQHLSRTQHCSIEHALHVSDYTRPRTVPRNVSAWVHGYHTFIPYKIPPPYIFGAQYSFTTDNVLCG